MTEYAEQLGFNSETAVVGNLQALVAYVFEKYPGARNDNKLLTFYFWLEHCGLAEGLTDVVVCPVCQTPNSWTFIEKFKTWFIAKARMPETITRRQRELQGDIGVLKPSRAVQRERAKKARQGPLRR